ncbi:hypothetical protein D3C78_1602720 [compost metagenome]
MLFLEGVNSIEQLCGQLIGHIAFVIGLAVVDHGFQDVLVDFQRFCTVSVVDRPEFFVFLTLQAHVVFNHDFAFVVGIIQVVLYLRLVLSHDVLARGKFVLGSQQWQAAKCK